MTLSVYRPDLKEDTKRELSFISLCSDDFFPLTAQDLKKNFFYYLNKLTNEVNTPWTSNYIEDQGSHSLIRSFDS